MGPLLLKPMRKQFSIFFTGFCQVLLVSANIYFISKLLWIGIAFCGFGISYIWTINVRKVVFGNKVEQLIYSIGAMIGGLAGVLMAISIKHL